MNLLLPIMMYWFIYIYISIFNLLQAEGEPDFKLGGSFTGGDTAVKRQDAEIKMAKDLGPTTESKYGQAR